MNSSESDEWSIQPIESCGPLDATVSVPGSKSITNRALVCAALAKGESVLKGALKSDDTLAMIQGLQKLGLEVTADWESETVCVKGCEGAIPAKEASVFVDGSGTTMRFLTAVCCLGRGSFELQGNQRMSERPVGDLVSALQQLGCEISATGDGFPPVRIQADGLKKGSTSIAGNLSSQFLSGLLMAAPCATGPIEIQIDGKLVSVPFVKMTLELMESFGVNVSVNESFTNFVVEPQSYKAIEYQIEPDATAASYFWGAAAVSGGSVTVCNLNRNSIQGDFQLVEVLRKMGCKTIESEQGMTVIGPALHSVDVDMGDFSDTVQTAAVVALFVKGTTTIRGIAHNRLKESDRIGDLARELRRVGADVTELDDGLRIQPKPLNGAEVETYNDHRMAMSMSLVGLRQSGIVIKDPGCVAKTFPDFFGVFESLYSQQKC